MQHFNKKIGIAIFTFSLISSFAYAEDITPNTSTESQVNTTLEQELSSYYSKIKELNKQKRQLYKDLSEAAKKEIKARINKKKLKS